MTHNQAIKRLELMVLRERSNEVSAVKYLRTCTARDERWIQSDIRWHQENILALQVVIEREKASERGQ